MEKLFKTLSIFLSLGIGLLIVLGMFFVNSSSKDLVKKGLIKNISIRQDDLIFQVVEDYASGVSIHYDSKTIYTQQLGKNISTLEIKNYSSILEDKKVYHFMLYNYDIGGNQFSGFDFCINDKQIYFGKTLTNC